MTDLLPLLGATCKVASTLSTAPWLAHPAFANCQVTGAMFDSVIHELCFACS